MRNYKNRWGDLWRITTNNVKCGMGNEGLLCSDCNIDKMSARCYNSTSKA